MSASSSNGAKPGFFGYLKGLFRRGDETNYTDTNGEDTSIVTEAMPLVPPPVEIALAAAPIAPVAAPAPQANTNLDTLGAGVTPGIAVPLQPILNNLAPELRERVRVQAVGDFTVNIALDKVLAQLAQGQVRIPFGDIRKAASHVFSPGADFDRISVALPLNEVLSRINPALLVRRTAVRHVEIPEEIASPFTGRGEGLSLSVGNAKPVQPAAPKKAAPVPPAPVRGSISSVPRPQAPAAAAAASIPAPFAFTPPKPAAPVAPAPVPFTAPAAPIQYHNVAPTPIRSAAPAFQPAPAPAAAQQPQPVVAPRPMAAPVSQAVITAGLNTLMETWPESLRLEILQTNLADARIAMPVDAVETALKRGRVTFAWKTIRSWITPATPTTVSVHRRGGIRIAAQGDCAVVPGPEASNGPAQQDRGGRSDSESILWFSAAGSACAATAHAAGATSCASDRFRSVVGAPRRLRFAPSLALNSAAAASTAAAASAAAAAAAAAACCCQRRRWRSRLIPITTSRMTLRTHNCSTSQRSSRKGFEHGVRSTLCVA
jgi:hypothetical protein